MTALVVLERGYAFQTLVAAARLERDDVDEHDAEPDTPEPGGDPGPMPTPIDHEETHVSEEYTPTTDEVRTAHRVALRGVVDPEAADAAFDRTIESVRAAERERIAKAIEGLPTTWPNRVKHSAAWMRLEAADVARSGAGA